MRQMPEYPSQACGVHIYTQGQFWPVELIELDEFQAQLIVPEDLSLYLHERVALKTGNLPSFPAQITAWEGRLVSLQFLGTMHPSVISQLGFDSIAA